MTEFEDNKFEEVEFEESDLLEEELPDEDLWRVGNQTAKNTPMQRNMKDCGILQCITMNYLCEDLPFNYDSTHCPLFRKKMALALMTNILE